MVSDMVVTLSLNALIGIANKAQESPEIIKNGIITGNLKSTLTSVLSCLDKLNNFTVSQDISNRLEKNRNTISQSLEQLNQIIYQMKQKNEGCYIATMVYGDYEHPKVKILRHFRDHVLSRFEIGRKFITFYYKNSPSWVVKSHNKILLNFIIREILNIFVWFYKNVKK